MRTWTRVVLAVAAAVTAAFLGIAVNIATSSISVSDADIVAGVSALLVSMGSLIVAAFATRRTAEEQGSTSEMTRFRAAVNLLSESREESKLSGLQALEDLAQEEAALRQVSVDEICRFLRYESKEMRESGDTDSISSDILARHVAYDAAKNILARHLRQLPGSVSSDLLWDDIDIDLRDTVLVDFIFSRACIRRASFERADFIGRTSLNSATFAEYSLFSGAAFRGHTDFSNVAFGMDAAFDDVRFQELASFKSATFTRDAVFVRASFQGDAIFEFSTFTDDALFDSASFAANTNFNRTSFVGKSRFVGIQFSGTTLFEFSHFVQDANFQGSRFNSSTSFEGSTFGNSLVLLDTNFEGELSIKRVSGVDETSLTSAQTFAVEAGYRRAIALGSDDALVPLARLLADQERPEEAEQLYRRAIALGRVGHD